MHEWWGAWRTQTLASKCVRAAGGELWALWEAAVSVARSFSQHEWCRQRRMCTACEFLQLCNWWKVRVRATFISVKTL